MESAPENSLRRAFRFSRFSVQKPLFHPADKEGGPLIELIQNPSAQACHGVTLAFHVADLEAHHSQLKEKGYTPKPIISPIPTVKFFMMEDPNGVAIQFM